MPSRTSGSYHRRVLEPLFGLLLHGGLATGVCQAAVHCVPEEHTTIQAAVDSAARGDTVLISAGTYSGPGNVEVTFRGKDLVVMSREGPQRTIIDCRGEGRGFHLRDDETLDSRIEGLTIKSGRALPNPIRAGGGILLWASDARIQDCVLDHCDAYTGGGLSALYARVVLERCVFSCNTADLNGGGLEFECLDLLARDCLFVENWGLEGGGAYLQTCGTNRFIGCTFTGNYAFMGGGLRSIQHLNLERSIVWGNDAIDHGPEMYVAYHSIRCCDVDSSGVHSNVDIQYDEDCIFEDPLFCDPRICLQGVGDWSLHSDSPCLPQESPCGDRIGALDAGCGPAYPTGACCLPDGSCLVANRLQCLAESGNYLGDGIPCVPDPCQANPVQVTRWGRIKEMFREP